MNHSKSLFLMLLVLASDIAIAPIVYADAVSPGIRDTGKTYSKEKPNSGWYGTGPGGRAMEAMDLRFDAQRLLEEGSYDEAILKAKKAVQFDPADPDTHVLLARCLTKKFYGKKGPVDEPLLRECMYEWGMIWHHDADSFNQHEAKFNYMSMFKISRAIQKRKEEEAKEARIAREQQAELRARKRDLALKEQAAADKEQTDELPAKTQAEDQSEPQDKKKKRFGLF